ncbi:MAG: nitrite reductase/ring-hydroxylating ferredoxin subunit [Planctomycetota bacterium]|jgi:nitrite reductase/ring-hydroxylating ferredoxin subunit
MNNVDEWTEVALETDVQVGELLTKKIGESQLVLGRSAETGLFALDNRCPHEGYPLASGDLKNCELTCVWHNWKFKVTDGSCVVGGEGVRSYPVRVVGGAVEVDLSEPDPASVHDKLRGSIEEGLFRYDNGRVFRDVARLLQAGYPAAKIAADVAAYDGRHAEYGTTHTLALAADAMRLLERYKGTAALYALGPVLDLCGESNQRMPARSYPEPVDCARDLMGGELRSAIEAEDVARADGILLSAFDAGVPRAEIESWIYAALSDHFLSFGHPLIYLVKAQELFESAGDERAYEILSGHLFGLMYSTREDTLPYMASYAKRLKALENDLGDLWKTADGSSEVDVEFVRNAVLDGTSSEAFDSVLDALKTGVAPSELARVLVGAAAHRLLRFNVALDSDPGVTENWLWATHRFTFASAVRNAMERFSDPLALRFLFQSVMFTHSGRAMDLDESLRVSQKSEPASVTEIVASIAARKADLAVAQTEAYLQSKSDLSTLKAALDELCLADGLVRPIVVAHGIKTTLAAWEEYDALEGLSDQAIPLLAAVRFLASPVVERRVRELAGRSLDWVVEGVMPKKLTQ